MSHCVPSWDNLDENPRSPRLDYQVTELTWENGQPAMHGLGLPRVPSGLLKATSSHATAKYTNNWEKGGGTSGGGGTLESIVNQATTTTTGQHKSTLTGCEGGGDDLLTWFVVPPSSGTATMAMDALVPCSKSSNNNDNNNISSPVLDPAQAVGKRVGGTSTHVGSCSGVRNVKLARVVGGDVASHDWSSRAELSVSNSGTCVKEYSRQVTFDTAGFTSTSTGSPENTSSGMQYTNKTADDDHDDSVCHGRTQSEIGEEAVKKKGTGKGSVSTKRSRAAAIHNQSERKRRDKINQRMKTLQKMIPNSSKSDKASMLDEVIEYLKQLQAQVSMVSRMNLPQMMLPLAMQQQQQMQMAMMGAPMGMGMPGLGMGMGFMDMNTMGRNNIPGMPPVLHPSAFMQPMTPWDGSGGGDNRLPSSGSPAIHDPLTSFLASQSQQPMTMDAYTRMATMFQQFQQLPGGPSTKN